MSSSDLENTKLSVESVEAFLAQFGTTTVQERIALEYLLEIIYEASKPSVKE